MATYKLNIATLDNAPPVDKLAETLDAFGLPEDDPFGVLTSSSSSAAAFATVIRRVTQTVQTLDPAGPDITSAAVEKVHLLPMGLFPKRGVLELYDGSATSIEQVAEFLASSLALPTVVNAIPLDIPAAIGKLRESTETFQLRGVRITDYAHNSYMLGTYGPKFLDTEHGIEFLAEYAEFVQTATVRFQAPAGRVNLTLCPTAFFRFSLSEDDDQPAVQAILRKLL
jgi:hypothetical protein